MVGTLMKAASSIPVAKKNSKWFINQRKHQKHITLNYIEKMTSSKNDKKWWQQMTDIRKEHEQYKTIKKIATQE